MWTTEQHTSPDDGQQLWYCVAPASYPLAGHPSRYPFDELLPDGRRAYSFTTQAAAQDAAARANARAGA